MTDDPYDMRANSVYKLREELAFALTERDALRAENARLTKERDNALHRAAEYRDKCNQLWNDNNLLRAGRKAMGETDKRIGESD